MMALDSHCPANRKGWPLACRVGLTQTYGVLKAECDVLHLVVFLLFRVTLKGSR